jgi:hypothetical protein
VKLEKGMQFLSDGGAGPGVLEVLAVMGDTTRVRIARLHGASGRWRRTEIPTRNLAERRFIKGWQPAREKIQAGRPKKPKTDRYLIVAQRFRSAGRVRLTAHAIEQGCTGQVLGAATGKLVEVTDRGTIKVLVDGHLYPIDHPPEFWEPLQAKPTTTPAPPGAKEE